MPVSIDELWQQVVEAPDDLGARLVLADALIEQGDERGELIALQCRGADANVFVGAQSVEHAAERISELIATHWARWLGDLAALVVRQGSAFQDGLLSLVQVGSESTPHAAWTQFAGHRELCAVKRVRPFKVRSDHYAMFLAALARDPPYVEVHQPLVIRNLRARRERWGVRHLRFGGIAWWSASEERGIVASEVKALSEIATDLETIDIPPTHAAVNELAEVVAQMPRLFPRLTHVRLENTRYGWLQGNEDRLREMKHVIFD